MEVKVTWKEGSETFNCRETESDVFQTVGKLLPSLSIPNKLEIETDHGNALFDVTKRGTYADKDGNRVPSMYVKEEYCLIYGLAPSMYEDRYLTCINPGSNNYKYYWLRPHNSQGVTTSVGATYGRIGSERGEAFGTKDLQEPYPSFMYWIRYYEKLSKGYTDQTDIYLSAIAKPEDQAKPVVKDDRTTDSVSAELYDLLIRYARNVVKKALVSERVTQKQITESKKIWKELCKRKTVKGFNAQVMKLMTISPRKARFVNEQLAYSEKDFADIIDREESLINAMQAVVNGEKVVESGKDFGLGFEIYEATDKQRAEVLSHLSTNLQGKVKRIWRVIPKEQSKRFNQYLKNHKIKTVKQFWHGSKNENWYSILTNSLMLHPNAAITGKMLGNGIYFAPSSEKSWNYTSYYGTYWANGTDDIGLMGLYATAYGDAWDIGNDVREYTKAEVENAGHNCVHAHADKCWLRADEVCFYDEAAVLLNYLVEFA